jgi:hypothetical protein
MKITIDIKTDNAAFQDDFNGELTEIINGFKFRFLESGYNSGILFDSNGNTAGKFKVTGK